MTAGAGPLVVVVGDVLVDVVVRTAGAVAAGSDTPSTIRWRQGGAAASTAVHLARAGTAVRLVGRVGSDAAAAEVRQVLDLAGVDLRLVVDAGAPTGTVVAIVPPDGSERDMYTDRGAAGRLSPGDLVRGWTDRATHLHLSGYVLLSPGTRDAGVAALAQARAAGLATSVDVASTAPLRDLGPAALLALLPAGCLLRANAAEAQVLTGLADPVRAVRALAAQVGEAVVTAGADGARWSDGTTTHHVPAPPVTGAVDPVGAGDAFTAGLLAARVAGAAPADQLAAGHRVAAAWIGDPAGA